MPVRQEQPDRARWKQATEVTGVQPGSLDTDHWLGTYHYRPASALLDFPRKCLFLSLPHWEVALLLISSLFIKGAPEESRPTIMCKGGKGGGEKALREKKNERMKYIVVAAWFFFSFHFSVKAVMTWNGMKIRNGPLCTLWLLLYNLHTHLFVQLILAQTHYGAEDSSGPCMIADSFEELRAV